MDIVRRKQIDEIFHAALDHEPSTRAAFLAEACKEDSDEKSELLGVSPGTVMKDWTLAKAWLQCEMDRSSSA